MWKSDMITASPKQIMHDPIKRKDRVKKAEEAYTSSEFGSDDEFLEISIGHMSIQTVKKSSEENNYLSGQLEELQVRVKTMNKDLKDAKRLIEILLTQQKTKDSIPDVSLFEEQKLWKDNSQPQLKSHEKAGEIESDTAQSGLKDHLTSIETDKKTSMKLFDITEVEENNRNDRDEPAMQHDEVKKINIQTNRKRRRKAKRRGYHPT